MSRLTIVRLFSIIIIIAMDNINLSGFYYFSSFVVLLLHDKLFINECVLRDCENWRSLA